MYVEHRDAPFSFLHGEKLSSKTHAIAAKSQLLELGVTDSVTGTLFITNYRVVFYSFAATGSTDTGGLSVPFLLEVPLLCIAVVSETASERSELFHVLDVKTKDFRVLRFGFPYDCTNNVAFNELKSLRQLSETKTLDQMFAFHHYTPIASHMDGWEIYNVEAEFRRQGVRFGDGSCGWRISIVNVTDNFNAEETMMCPSYPQQLIVPVDVSDGQLRSLARYRARQRVPIASYIHQTNGASITRSAQPLVGLTRSRNTHDENTLRSIRLATPGNKELVIVDCRSYTAAFANSAIGGGFENICNYDKTKILFMNMDNIHAVRDSYRKLFYLCRSVVHGSESSTNWLSAVESTHWLDHVRTILVAASNCAELIHVSGLPILLHCSDGWDRTSQLSAVTQILLDPYFRTRRGFAVLVEKEFLSMGHCFGQRLGQESNINFFENDHVSPVFVLFIDCVWQILRLFPMSFEFNGFFLSDLLDLMYSGRCGTFLGNSDLERLRFDVKRKTISVWTALLHLSSHRDNHTNPFYTIRGVETVLLRTFHLRDLSLWTDYYFRYIQPSPTQQSPEQYVSKLRCDYAALITKHEAVEENCKKMRSKLDSLREDKRRMEKEIASLKLQVQVAAKGRPALPASNSSAGTAASTNPAGQKKGIIMEEDTDDNVLLSVTTNTVGLSSSMIASPLGHSSRTTNGTIAGNPGSQTRHINIGLDRLINNYLT
jgi:myotubularin-related protein 1/2